MLDLPEWPRALVQGETVKKIIYICAQYNAFPYLTRRLRYEMPFDVDVAVATYKHFKADEGREYSRVWWYHAAA